jgi:hypothetical protein
MPGLAPRTERLVALGIASALVIARSFVYLAYEHAYFDSDQAIVGLMAKHLSEGRAFPLFFYGQAYMLAVESWLAVPFFWIAGPTVAALRSSLVLTNLASAVLIILGLERYGGLRPLYGLVAALFFIFPPPMISALLVDAMGGNVEPFFYVPLLWLLRNRPLWFGAVLGIGFLNREFTIYVVPVVLAAQALEGRLFRREAVRAWLLTAVAFLAVWEGVQALKPYADLMGPGTRGQLLRGFDDSQIANLTGRVRVVPRELPERIWVAVTTQMPRLLGGVRIEVPPAWQGRNWMAWALAAAFVAASVRIVTLALLRPRPKLVRAAFGWYLIGVGLASTAGYVLARPVVAGATRYMLLALLIPVGITAVLLALEPRAWLRRIAVASVLVWAAFSGIDNLQHLRRYQRGSVTDSSRPLADALTAKGVGILRANYWRAYKLTFLTGERVKIASTGLVRIREYQELAAGEGKDLLLLGEQPCAGGQQIAPEHFLCPTP